MTDEARTRTKLRSLALPWFRILAKVCSKRFIAFFFPFHSPLFFGIMQLGCTERGREKARCAFIPPHSTARGFRKWFVFLRVPEKMGSLDRGLKIPSPGSGRRGGNLFETIVYLSRCDAGWLSLIE